MKSAKTTATAIHCIECGKPVPKIPNWLIGAEVRFHCAECSQKHSKTAGIIDTHTRVDADAPGLSNITAALDGGEGLMAADEDGDEAAEVDED